MPLNCVTWSLSLKTNEKNKSRFAALDPIWFKWLTTHLSIFVPLLKWSSPVRFTKGE